MDINTKLSRWMATVVLLVATVLPSFAGGTLRGRKSMGIYGGYATRSESGVAGIYFNYRFSQCFMLAPSADYVFRHIDEDGFNIDLNAFVPFAVNSAQTVSLYPIGGVGYSAINRRSGSPHYRSPCSSRQSRRQYRPRRPKSMTTRRRSNGSRWRTGRGTSLPTGTIISCTRIIPARKCTGSGPASNQATASASRRRNQM